MLFSLRFVFLLVCSLLLITVGNTSATPAPPNIPEALQPWVPWVEHRLGELPCTAISEGEICAWPAQLRLQLTDKGGEFSLIVTMQKAGKITLPGDENAWPQKVTIKRLEGTSSEQSSPMPLPIALYAGTPVAYLDSGRYELEGSFEWDAAPGVIRVPTDIAIVNLSVAGREVKTFDRPATGSISLRELLSSQPIANEDEVSISVFRLIEDGIPFKVTTRLVVNVASERLQVSIPDPSPLGTTLTGVESSSPYFISDKGELSFALPSGTHTIDLLSISPTPLTELQTPKDAPNWPTEEVWTWKEQRELRVATLSGGTPIDPNLTSLPPEWISYPAFSLTPGSMITIDASDKDGRSSQKKIGAVTLQRRLTQDIAGSGYTIEDRLVGTLGGSGRLSMAAPTDLGAAETPADPLLITTDIASGLKGVEVRQEQFEITARSRLDLTSETIPVVGWDRDVDWLKVTLQLPTWKEVLWVNGADSSVGTRLSAWNLGSVFLIVLVSILACKVLGLVGGIATLVCVPLLHGEGANLLDIFILLLIGIPFLKREKNSIVWGSAYVAALLWMVVNTYLFVSGDIMTRIHPDYHRSLTRAASITLPSGHHTGSSMPHQGSGSHSSLGSSSVKYNDTRIADATNAVMIYAEGSFGALIMLVCGAISLLCLALRRFKSAALAAAAFVAAFGLRSLMSTFFNDANIMSSSSQYESYDSIASNLGIQRSKSYVQKFGEQGAMGAAGAPMAQDAEMDSAAVGAPPARQKRALPLLASSASSGSLVTQTGPGVPQWQGREVTLSWEGAVPKGHTISLVTLSFGAGMALAVVRGILLFFLIFLIWRAAPPQIAEFLKAIKHSPLRKSPSSTSTATIVVAIVVAGGLCCMHLPTVIAQEHFPPEKILTELEERLKEDRNKALRCKADCVSTEHLQLTLTDNTITGVALVHSIGKNPWVLPTLPQRAALEAISLNGAPVTAASRVEQGTIVLLEDGVHRVTFTIPLVPRTPATLTLSQLAGRITTKADGYKVFTEKTENGTIIQFLPEGVDTSTTGDTSVTGSRSAGVTPWYTVTRRIVIGSDIKTELLIHRIGDLTKDGALELPLIVGERILDSGVKRREGGIVVTTKAGSQESISYSGLIPNPEGEMQLTAPTGAKYSEDWVVQCATQWSCTFEGLQPVEKFENGQAYYHFTPRPGDKTKFLLTKLNGAAGATQTVLLANVTYEPSSHFLRGTLSVAIKAGQAGSQKVTIPEAAQIKEIKINNQDVLDITDTKARPLELSVLKGTHLYKIVWQIPSELSMRPTATPVLLHGEYSNGSSTFKVPSGWLPVAAFPGQLGPYFGITSFIVIELLLFLALSIILPLPIPRWQAVIIVLGATALGPFAAHLTCAWIYLCGILQRVKNIDYPALTGVLASRGFLLARLCAVLIPVGVLALVTAATFNSHPDLQILGESSSKEQLTWYLDRGTDALPTPSLVMIPDIAWQIAILIWGVIVALLACKIIFTTVINDNEGTRRT